MEDELKEQLRQRLELLHRRINELTEQQNTTEKQIRTYKQLVRYYHAVYEAEHGLGIEGQLEPGIIAKLDRIISEEPQDKAKEQYKSVPEAVIEVLVEKAQPLHASEIAKEVAQKYPDMKDRVKNVERQVVVALVRGVQQDMYERVGRNIYRLKPKKK
ncbi:hypothetical protein ACFLTY_02485 [Chloroflexota bacterium]